MRDSTERIENEIEHQSTNNEEIELTDSVMIEFNVKASLYLEALGCKEEAELIMDKLKKILPKDEALPESILEIISIPIVD